MNVHVSVIKSVVRYQWVFSLFGLVFCWDQTAQLWSQSDVEFNQSQPRVIADIMGDSSLISPHFYVYFWNSDKVKWFSLSNWLSYAKSSNKLINFGFSDRSVQSFVSAKRSANCWVQTKKQLHFLADLWSQSELRTQWKTDPESEITHYNMCMCVVMNTS